MSPAVRISLGLVALTLSLVLIADTFFGLFPDTKSALLEARKRFCESLAVQYSTLVDAGEINAIKESMQIVADRSDEVLSIALISNNDGLLASTPRHAQLWTTQPDGRSTPTHANIPIFQGSREWGAVQVRFTELGDKSLLAMLDSPLYRLIIVLVAGGFAVYLLFMKRTLRYLDPSSVVPGRVKAALDQLVEGAVLTDEHLRIVLTNAAFETMVERSPENLLGTELSALNWQIPKEEKLPWEHVRDVGSACTEVRLELPAAKHGTSRAFTTNVSPITDGDGTQRGLLATFNDVTELEAANSRLQQAVARLELAQAEVQRQNEELNRLATEDPLTGCLNRRAFFERLEAEFAIATNEHLPLACVMADIDHFKRINDTFGHAVGDEMIKLTVDVIQDHLQPNDALGRYGGEEFCIVLVGTSEEGARLRAEQIREAFRTRSAAPDSPVEGKPCTASLGVSFIGHGARNPSALVDEADQALYASKTGGRNRVSLWSELDSLEAVES